MLGLMVFGALFLYILISIAVIIAAISWADKSGNRPGTTGLIAALVMYNLVFWDLIPVYGLHSYQCENNAGFTVYKTIEEWGKENPGVAETLVAVESTGAINYGNTSRYMLNQRFAWEITREKFWHIIKRVDEKIIDTVTGEVLAEEVDFNAQVLGLNRGGTFSEFKFWFDKSSCFKKEERETKWLVNGDSFYSLYLKYKNFNGDEK
mgnify:FL=1